MIAEPQPTRYDLPFRLLRFPVRVHPLFWLVTVMMGWPDFREEAPLPHLAVWVAVVFVSILVHELGHALAFRRFGSPARVWLYWFGGLAVSDYPPTRPVRRILVSLAGPAAGFLLAAVVYGTGRTTGWPAANDFTWDAYVQLMWVNLTWGLVNLLPVLPLDGGHVCVEVCRLGRVRRPEATAFLVSVVVGAGVAVLNLMSRLGYLQELIRAIPLELPLGSLYVTIMFGLLAYSNYEAYQRVRGQGMRWDDADDDTPPWRR